MTQCYSSGDFKKYFKENMDALGMPVPDSYFKTYVASVSTATFMVAALEVVGKGATMAELIGATTQLEGLAVAAAFGASIYTGAVIGSIAVASYRAGACGARIADMFSSNDMTNRLNIYQFIADNNLQFTDWQLFYIYHPEILDKTSRWRSSFAARMLKQHHA